MKKNININLFGTLYANDEDACTLLQNYHDDQSESNSNASNDPDSNTTAEEAIGGKWINRVLHHVSTHRFNRDGKDKIAGGVISGLSH